MESIDIDKETKQLLMLSDEGLLTRTIWGLSREQKNTLAFREVGQQRYLSALRVGNITMAEMARVAFALDVYFLKSKIVLRAAAQGFYFQVEKGEYEIARTIKSIMELGENCVIPTEESAL
jgi:hypothetical protein